MADVRDSSQILVRIDDRLFGLPAVSVREMLACPAVTEVPCLPEAVRGLLNLRGEVIPLLDLRRRLGVRSRIDQVAELVQLLHDREADHCRWVETLRACVAEGRELSLQTDPRLCAFGRWYYAFKTTNRVLSTALARFETPHAEIHGAAVTIKGLLDKGDRAGVDAAIARLDKDLADMRRLFADAREKVAGAFLEIVVVVAVDGAKPFALTVDHVEAVEPLVQLEPPPTIAGARLDSDGMVWGVARRQRDDATVLLLQPAALGAMFATLEIEQPV